MALLFPSFGLGSLFYVGVLLVNAIAVLSEDRFLARIGWSPNSVTSEPSFGAPQDGNSIKSKIVTLITSVRMLARIPLIGINTLVIIYLFTLG
ncbi:hypothetical protein Vi05172_g9662 [Venturia inaequalis]|nr:hypothetical protein Vi05172_g9662 [Venturia inaequalis]